MNREEALRIVKEQITEKRYIHTIGVMETAIKLATKYGGNVEKAELAAIFHDYAKFRSKDEMKKIIVGQNMDPNLLLFHSELWHAPVGAFLVEKEVGIKDKEILDAIRYHTSGRPEMSKLEKIIYLADYIEPGRAFLGVDEVRELAEVDFDRAFLQAVKNTIIFLIRNNRAVFPLSFEAYNSYCINMEVD
ncbi:bis(5'-nucleosyl)-tetraphosphatase (symmetrical) YqeK [Niallia sp.]|uniref:bis(5'-nucleosyl)-tetraphosphatase (symmetrical) YqeK n=1 Tax=Niallia sp. TaxID=2837523 RepID=UPI0028965BB1|nr:bis(5'-nucleosyl)-tetraphosphatase (symmetrical) YqeK [Niallia sp.]